MMSPRTDYTQKYGKAIRIISRDLLCLNEGDTISPIADYEMRFEFSRWTIQTAIRLLLESKCFRLEKHGSKGSIIYDINRSSLLIFADWNPIIVFAPSSSGEIHEALFTGLKTAFDRSCLPVIMGFMTPSSLRFESLSAGRCHLILTSRLAARISQEKYADICLALDMGTSKYCLPHLLYIRDGKHSGIEDGMAVGIHASAIEQSYISELLCEGKSVIRRYGNYHECLRMLETGEIDALVQRGDIKEEPLPHFPSIPLSQLGLDEESSAPVLMCGKNEYGIIKLVKKEFDPLVVAKVQQEVLAGHSRPGYY